MSDDVRPVIKEKVFAFYLGVIDSIIPVACGHTYHFMADEAFARWRESEDFNWPTFNAITSLELLDKAHLAAITALIRTKRWAVAVCLMEEANNLVGWASSARGLLESSGDIVDGLLNIGADIAAYHQDISRCLSGQQPVPVALGALEGPLDHFVLGQWMRSKKGDENNPLRAKDNAFYVGRLEAVLPGATAFYHRLCAIAHPSKASIEYLYKLNGKEGGLMVVPTNDASAISALRNEFPNALTHTLMMSCNPPLLILRVLHKFRRHPKLDALRKLKWDNIKAWPGIERSLKR
jgi:hypothetical protein